MTGLSGHLVINTRSTQQAPSLTELLRPLGAEVCEFPLLEIQALPYTVKATRPEWVLFTSANAVTAAARDRVNFGQFEKSQCAVIGEGTARAARELGLQVQFVAEEANSDAFGRELVQFWKDQGAVPHAVLLLQGEGVSGDISRQLQSAGIVPEEQNVYRAVCPQPTEEQFRALGNGVLKHGGKRCVTVITSSQAARNLVTLLQKRSETWAQTVLKQSAIAVIGPKTALTARELGLSVKIAAPARSVETIVEAIVEWANHSG